MTCDCGDCKAIRSSHKGGWMSRAYTEALGGFDAALEPSFASYFNRVEESARPAQTYSANSGSAGRLTVDDMNKAMERLRNYNVTLTLQSGASISGTAYLDYFPTSKEKPMSSENTPTKDRVIDDIRRLPEGTDLSDVSGALAATEERHRAAIEGALQGVVKLELIKGVQSKRFVLVYFRNGREYITYGIAYPGYSMDSEKAEKKIKGDTVWLNIGEDRWFRYQHKTMDALREHLRERKIPHRIAFFDE